jgi:hypothetical protein
MTDPSPRSGAAYEDLLVAMAAMAEVANKFASENNQRTAFAVLLSAYGLPGNSPASTELHEPGLSIVPPLNGGTPEDHSADEGSPAAASSPSASAKRRSSKKKSSARPLDVDFRPQGKVSLVDFAAEKAPGSVAEKSALAIYYVAEILGTEAVEAGHVLAAFRECQWPDPSPSIEAALQVNACKKNYFVTSNMKNITLTSAGRNLVHYLMPTKAKKSA